MNRRGFLRAVSATGLMLLMQSPAVWAAGVSKDDMDAMIREALQTRRRLKFKYHGHSRVVEPHAVGLVTGDRRALLGWQVSGGSDSEPPPGWRTFVLPEITGLKLMRRTFTPRPEYRPETRQLKSVEAEVARKP